MKPLISLDDYNRIAQKHFERQALRKTGIACPRCGAELVDAHPDVILPTMPPRKAVQCRNCLLFDYRIIG